MAAKGGAVSSGIRRVEGLTGEAARAYLQRCDATLREAAATLKTTPGEVPARIAALVMSSAGAETPGPEEVAGVAYSGRVIDALDAKRLRGAVDEVK